MQRRRPSRRSDSGTEAPRGITRPVQGDRQQGAPRAPHERDESSDSQTGGEPSMRGVGDASQNVGEIAHDDLESGRVDTDMGPPLDDTYHRIRKN